MKTVWCEILHNNNNPLILFVLFKNKKKERLYKKKKKEKWSTGEIKNTTTTITRREKKNTTAKRRRRRKTRVDTTAPAGRHTHTHLGPCFFLFYVFSLFYSRILFSVFFLFLVVAGGITLDLMTSPSEKKKIKVSQFLGIFFTLKN
jgi:hypothetical protein